MARDRRNSTRLYARARGYEALAPEQDVSSEKEEDHNPHSENTNNTRSRPSPAAPHDARHHQRRSSVSSKDLDLVQPERSNHSGEVGVGGEATEAGTLRGKENEHEEVDAGRRRRRLFSDGSMDAIGLLEEGRNFVHIVVTSQDGSATKKYTIDVLRQEDPKDLRLVDLKFSQGEQRLRRDGFGVQGLVLRVAVIRATSIPDTVGAN